IGADVSAVFALDAGFDPYSLRFSNGPGSVATNAGIPQTLATAYSDSSRAGQWYNGQGYVGLSSPTYGTLTVFRQNSLTLDAVFDYDPFAASYAFSPIGFQGTTCGVGNTENCRNSTSLKYRINIGQFRAAALCQFGGYDHNNGSNGAYISSKPAPTSRPGAERRALGRRNLQRCHRLRVARACAGNH